MLLPRFLLTILPLAAVAGGCGEECPRWESEPLDPRISRIDGNVGIAESGEVFYPAPDGGQVFTFQVYTELGTPLYGLAGNQPTMLAAGEAGAIFFSESPNTTWERAITPSIAEDLLAVRITCQIAEGTAIMSEVAVAVGESGRIVRSTSSGMAWELVESPTSRTLRSVATGIGEQSDIVVAVGDAGTIVRSADQGATWETITSGTAQDLAWVDFITPCHVEASHWDRPWWGLAVGAGGTVLRSIDDGLSWQALDLGISDDLRQVHVHSDTLFLGEGRLWRWGGNLDLPMVFHDFEQAIDWYADDPNRPKAGGEGQLFWLRKGGYCPNSN